jgi:putative tricarboxylic transport membrane protein
MRVIQVLLVSGSIAAATVATAALAQEWKPQKNVELIVSAGAGGAADRQARLLQRFLQSVPGIASVTVNNKQGGGGTIAWTYLGQHAGDPHYLATLTTGLLTNEITGASKISYRDFTPISLLMREYIVASVRADSPIANARDLLARLKQDPGSVTLAFANARGNQNHVVIGMLAKAGGIDPKGLKLVVFNAGSEGATAVLGGHVDVLVTPGTALHMRRPARRASSASLPRNARKADTPRFLRSGTRASTWCITRGAAPLAPRG